MVYICYHHRRWGWKVFECVWWTGGSPQTIWYGFEVARNWLERGWLVGLALTWIITSERKRYIEMVCTTSNNTDQWVVEWPANECGGQMVRRWLFTSLLFDVDLDKYQRRSCALVCSICFCMDVRLWWLTKSNCCGQNRIERRGWTIRGHLLRHFTYITLMDNCVSFRCYSLYDCGCCGWRPNKPDQVLLLVFVRAAREEIGSGGWETRCFCARK